MSLRTPNNEEPRLSTNPSLPDIKIGSIRNAHMQEEIWNKYMKRIRHLEKIYANNSTPSIHSREKRKWRLDPLSNEYSNCPPNSIFKMRSQSNSNANSMAAKNKNNTSIGTIMPKIPNIPATNIIPTMPPEPNSEGSNPSTSSRQIKIIKNTINETEREKELMRNRIALLQQQELKAQKNILYARKKAQFLLKQKQEREANLFRELEAIKEIEEKVDERKESIQIRKIFDKKARQKSLEKLEKRTRDSSATIRIEQKKNTEIQKLTRKLNKSVNELRRKKVSEDERRSERTMREITLHKLHKFKREHEERVVKEARRLEDGKKGIKELEEREMVLVNKMRETKDTYDSELNNLLSIYKQPRLSYKQFVRSSHQGLSLIHKNFHQINSRIVFNNKEKKRAPGRGVIHSPFTAPAADVHSSHSCTTKYPLSPALCQNSHTATIQPTQNPLSFS